MTKPITQKTCDIAAKFLNYSIEGGIKAGRQLLAGQIADPHDLECLRILLDSWEACLPVTVHPKLVYDPGNPVVGDGYRPRSVRKP